MNKRRKAAAQPIDDRVSANRDRAVEEVFSELERLVIREQLSKDAPTREKERYEQRATSASPATS
jgi:hypothetical protein